MTEPKMTKGKVIAAFKRTIYHLKAMEYHKDKLQKMMATLPSNHIEKAERLHEIIHWYSNSVEYHRMKAMGHAPDCTRINTEKLKRHIENMSLSGIKFIPADKIYEDMEKAEEEIKD